MTQHSQSTKDKMKALSELGFSSREIAKLVLGSETKKSSVNRVLASEGTTSKPKKDAEDNSRILFISDLHIPYHHPDSFAFLQYLKEKYKPTRVICLGDECDKHSLSFHDSDPDLYSAGHELIETQKHMRILEQMFPRMDIVDSNHGSLVWRKAKTNGIPRHYIKSYNDVLGVGDGWKWQEDLTLVLPNGQSVYVHHGKASDGLKLSQTSSMNCVQGHYHEKFNVQWWANSLGLYWSMQCGCLIDSKSYAFQYANVNLRKQLIGTGLVIDSIPVLEPMILLPDGRWKGP